MVVHDTLEGGDDDVRHQQLGQQVAVGVLCAGNLVQVLLSIHLDQLLLLIVLHVPLPDPPLPAEPHGPGLHRDGVDQPHVLGWQGPRVDRLEPSLVVSQELW